MYFFKVPQRDDEWISKRRKDTEGKHPKNISVCQYIFLKITYKSMYKIITPLFLQKSLEAYRNSGIQQN